MPAPEDKKRSGLLICLSSTQKRIGLSPLVNKIWFINGVDNIQLSPEGEVNSGGYIPRREASRYISTTLHRP